MMKYTARSMLAIAAVAVMQGESMTQTDALQIKKLQGNRGKMLQQEGARRFAAASGGALGRVSMGVAPSQRIQKSGPWSHGQKNYAQVASPVRKAISNDAGSKAPLRGANLAQSVSGSGSGISSLPASLGGSGPEVAGTTGISMRSLLRRHRELPEGARAAPVALDLGSIDADAGSDA